VVMLSPILGGFGAVLLFAFLTAGLFQGPLFPAIPPVSYNSFSDALDDMFNVHLKSSTEAAKLYLFCFLAGFSERLVPDALSRFSAIAQKEK
jgi:hypothetical protein